MQLRATTSAEDGGHASHVKRTGAGQISRDRSRYRSAECLQHQALGQRNGNEQSFRLAASRCLFVDRYERRVAAENAMLSREGNHLAPLLSNRPASRVDVF